MTFQMPDPAQPIRRPAGTRRRGRVLLPTLVVIGVVLVTFGLFTNFWTDWLWYTSIDYRRVFTTELTTKALLFFVFGALMAGAVAGKQIRPLGPGTFRTDTPVFVVLLIFTVVIVAALTFFPAFLLGPIVQGLTDQLF